MHCKKIGYVFGSCVLETHDAILNFFCIQRCLHIRCKPCPCCIGIRHQHHLLAAKVFCKRSIPGLCPPACRSNHEAVIARSEEHTSELHSLSLHDALPISASASGINTAFLPQRYFASEASQDSAPPLVVPITRP